MKKDAQYYLDLIDRFIIADLPKDEWTHEAHIIAGIYALHNNDFNQVPAHKALRRLITAHNESVGTINGPNSGYHDTLTWMWVCHIAKVIKQNHQYTYCTDLRGYIVYTLELIESCFHKHIITQDLDDAQIEKLFSKEARNNIIEIAY